MGNDTSNSSQQPQGRSELQQKKPNQLKNTSSLSCQDLDEPSFLYRNLQKIKNETIILASKNLLSVNNYYNINTQAITQGTNFPQLIEEQCIIEGRKRQQTFLESERVKIKRPNFKKIAIDPFQFIQKKKKSIREDYELIKIIGSGSYGEVYYSFSKKTNQFRAVKKIEKAKLSADELKMLANQFQILGRMDHPNIIKLYQIYEEYKYMYVVTEYCEGGSLIRLMNKFKLKENQIRIIMTQILSAVTYMHSKSIIHKDIKPQNIVLVNKIKSYQEIKNIQLKFIDFGISMDLSKQNQMDSQNIFGTLLYMPPQSMLGTIHFAWDIWSCGIICYAMATNKMPYSKNINHDELCSLIKRAKLNRANLQLIQKQLKIFIMSMLEKSYLFRTTASQALKNVWMAKGKKKGMKHTQRKKTVACLKKYDAKNNFISIIEGYLVCKKINQSQRQHLANLFSQIDEDKSGIIEVEELKKFYQQNSEHYDAEEVQNIITTIDKNKSGKIDFNEFITAMCSRRKLFSLESLGQAFDFFDQDKSGELSKGQIISLLAGVESEELQYLFKILDSDQNSLISRKEFIAYFQKIMEGQ